MFILQGGHVLKCGLCLFKVSYLLMKLKSSTSESQFFLCKTLELRPHDLSKQVVQTSRAGEVGVPWTSPRVSGGDLGLTGLALGKVN